MKRRDFVKTTASAAAAGTLGLNMKTKANSPNDTIRVAVVGFRGQGGRAEFIPHS